MIATTTAAPLFITANRASTTLIRLARLAFPAMVALALILECSSARAYSCQEILNAFSPAYWDPDVYKATQAQLAPKVSEAAQHPERAKRIAHEIFSDEDVSWSPVAPGYTPETEARVAAACEAIIAVLQNVPQPQSTQTATQTATATQTSTYSLPTVNTAVGDVNNGSAATNALEQFFSTLTGSGTSTATGTGTNTSTHTGTSAGANTGINGSGINGYSRSTQSDVTGLGGVHSTYTPITQSSAQNIVGKYQSIPGGVTLEGQSLDFAFVKSVRYLADANAFILSDDIIYLCPVSLEEFSEIAAALETDDRLGVSLGKNYSLLVYGKLSPQSNIITNLTLADGFLGDLAFGSNRFTGGYVFAPGHEGKRPAAFSELAVYFNLHDFHFAETSDGELRRSNYALDSTLVPLTDAQNKDGGHIPDFGRINSSDIPREFVDNLQHLQRNIDYYAREKILRVTSAYGETAAFIRSLRAANIKIDWNKR